MAAALEGLHRSGLCHYDVAPNNIFKGTCGWTLIDPTTSEGFTEYYTPHHQHHGEARDIISLGRTFLFLYRGTIAEEFLVEEELEDEYEFRLLLRRMLLRENPYCTPDATAVRRAASRLLVDRYRIASPRFPSRPGDADG